MAESSEDLEGARREEKEHLGSKGLEGSVDQAYMEEDRSEGRSQEGSLNGMVVESQD